MDTSIYRGDTWIRTWSFTNNQNIPISLVGASARLQLRQKVGSETILVDASSSGNYLIIDGESGIIRLVVPPVITKTLLGKYYFDLEVTFQNGIVKTYESGTLIVIEDVTR